MFLYMQKKYIYIYAIYIYIQYIYRYKNKTICQAICNQGVETKAMATPYDRIAARFYAFPDSNPTPHSHCKCGGDIMGLSRFGTACPHSLCEGCGCACRAGVSVRLASRLCVFFSMCVCLLERHMFRISPNVFLYGSIAELHACVFFLFGRGPQEPTASFHPRGPHRLEWGPAEFQSAAACRRPRPPARLFPSSMILWPKVPSPKQNSSRCVNPPSKPETFQLAPFGLGVFFVLV